MKNILKKILIHFLLYLVACFVGVLQFSLLITLIFFTKNIINIGLGIIFLVMLLYPIICLPFYLIFLLIITIQKIRKPVIYIIGAMITSASFSIFMTFFWNTENYLVEAFMAILFALFGIIPGLIYHHFCKKYSFAK